MAWLPADETSERVMAIVAEQTGWNRRAIRPESEVERDLGCTGDDARELLFRLERELGIDMTGMEFRHHFDEGRSPGWPIAVPLVLAVPTGVLAMHGIGLVTRALGIDGPHFMRTGWFFVLVYFACAVLIGLAASLLPAERIYGVKKTPVTVQHLIDAAHTGKWPFSVSQGEVA